MKLKNISIHIQSKKPKEVFNKVMHCLCRKVCEGDMCHVSDYVACFIRYNRFWSVFQRFIFKYFAWSKKGSPKGFPIYAPMSPIWIDLDRIKWTRSEIDHESEWPDFLTGFHFRVLGSKRLNCKQYDELHSEIRIFVTAVFLEGAYGRESRNLVTRPRFIFEIAQWQATD